MHFTLDDISHYVDLFHAYGIDIEMIAGEYHKYDQITPEQLDNAIEAELQKDAMYQVEEWIKKDRAYEAMSLIENDGENNGLDGRIRRLRQSAANSTRRPKINLIKGNRDRILSQLSSTSFEMRAYAVDDSKREAVHALNDRKDSVLVKEDFESRRQSVITDGITYGSGVFYIGYGEKYDSPDLSLIGSKVAKGDPLSYDEYMLLQQAIKSHKIKHVSTFEIIRYRGAKGEKAVDFGDPCHRWIHHVEQIPIAQARREYPEYADQIAPEVSGVYTDTNPQAYFHQDIDSTVTRLTTYVKFLVSGIQEVDVENPMDGEIIEEEIPVMRYATAKFTRLVGVGVVDCQIDKYHHNRPPFVQFIYTPSERHACGIGVVKYGRDPMIVHNMLHHGMLEYLATMSKGGGFVDERLGLTQSQLNARTKPGTFVPVQVPVELHGKTLKDLIVENRPPQFPSVYSDLMAIESRAIDESMSVPNVYKGIRSGESGRQEAILQNQADLVHSYAISNLKKSYHPIAIIIFSNIVQFDREPYEFYVDDRVTNERRKQVINYPVGHYIHYDTETLESEIRASDVINDITDLIYTVRVESQDIVPHKPAEKALYYQEFFNNTVNLIENPKTRLYLRYMNKFGFRLHGLDEALQAIEELEANINQQNAALAEGQANEERRGKEREFQLKAREQGVREAELGLKAQQSQQPQQ